MLDHAQSAFYEQALRPVHKKIYLLWNGISGLFLIMVQNMSLTEKGINPIALLI